MRPCRQYHNYCTWPVALLHNLSYYFWGSFLILLIFKCSIDWMGRLSKLQGFFHCPARIWCRLWARHVVTQYLVCCPKLMCVCCAICTEVFEKDSCRIEWVWPARGFYAMHLPVLSHFRNWVGPGKSTFGLYPHPNCRETSALVIILCPQEGPWNAGRLSLRSWPKLCFVQPSPLFSPSLNVKS